MTTIFYIISFVFCTAITSAGILIANRLVSNYAEQFLRNYLYYLISFYAFAFYGIWAQLLVRYGLSNISVDSQQLSTLVNFLPILGVPFLFISWLMLLKMSDQMGRRKSQVRHEIITHSTIVLLAMVILIPGNMNPPAFIAGMGTQLPTLSLATLLFIEGIYFLLYGFKTKRRAKSAAYLSNYSLLLYGGYVLRISLLIVSIFYDLLLPLTITLYFLSNLLPLLYLWQISDQYLEPLQGDSPAVDEISKLVKRYKVTKREQEIIEQISLGKTNQQIADELFISLQTVKDHTHRIYKKIGVNSRMKLIRLLNGERF